MLVEHRMLREAREVHRIGTVADLAAIAVDLDQVGSSDLLPQQTVGIDQEGVVFPRHPQRDVVVDALAPAKVREDAVAGGELLPRGPFRLAALRIAPELGGHSAGLLFRALP
jgi:hypothetical protein